MTLLLVRGIPIKLHPSMLALLVFCLLTAEASSLLLAMLLVFLHEAAHCLVAAWMGVRVVEMELAPFGGVARMEGLEERPGAEALVALAGPGCNLLLAMMGCFVCSFFSAAAMYVSRFIALNLCLCLFNLLPALPLDGGRLLRAALSLLLGRRRAGTVAAVLGIVLGLGMGALGALLYFMGGKLNITLLISGLYLLLCALRILRERPFDGARELLRLERASLRGQVLPVRTLAAPADTPPQALLGRFRPGSWHKVVYVDEDLRVVDTKWQGEIVGEALYGKAADN